MAYISLKEATRFCNYSQDYLKLRSRQGKLKAVKIGRNWVTTAEWVDEYLVSKHPRKVSTNNQPRKLIEVRTWWLGLIVLLLLAGGILNRSQIIKEYFQWLDSQAKFQTANLSESFGELWKIIPGRVIEIENSFHN